jgi:Na(+)-translocating NADH:ubiquinone oxidoreductase A subunit
MLVPTLLGLKFPYGYSAANLGVIVLNIQAALHVYRAVTAGEPLIERIIALCGPGFRENLHLRVRIGTPLEYLLMERLRDNQESRIVLNSLLTGETLDRSSLPVNKTFSNILAIHEDKKRRFLAFARPGLHSDSYFNAFLSKISFSRRDCGTNMHGEERPCISCGRCEEICPVDIVPHLLSKYVQRELVYEEIMRYKIFNCIECNLCSYVCPSKIPLAGHIKEGQKKLTLQGCNRAQCILPHVDVIAIDEYRGLKEV